MAGVVETFIASWSGGSGYSRVDIGEGGRDNNAGWVDINWWVGSRGTWGSISGTWDWARYGLAGNQSGSAGAATGIRGIQSGTTRAYCDANGNYGEYGIGMHWDMFYGQGDAISTITPSRSPLAPSRNNPTVTNLSVVTATLNGSVSSNGHGTSTTIYLRYKKTSDGSWTELSSGSTKNITDLTPSTEYQVQVRGVNNMGDDSGYGNQITFTTLPAPNTSAALLAIVGVL